MVDKYIGHRKILEMLGYEFSYRNIIGYLYGICLIVIVSSRAPCLDISDTKCERRNLVSHSEIEEELLCREREINMRGSLEDTMSTTTGDWVDTSVDETLCHTHGRDHQGSLILRIIVNRVRNSTRNYLIHDICSFLWHELESIECILSRHISDDVGDDIEFLGRNSNVFD